MSKRTNKILPAALATTLAFGAAPFAVSAEVDLNALDETYPSTVDWTEEEWDVFLDENFGTSLADYETNEELAADLGEPINTDDINAWISGDQSNGTLIEVMEAYDITGEELGVFLSEIDNLEDIHFVGQIEGALEEGGYTPVVADEPEASEEEPEEDLIDDELADAEIFDPVDGYGNIDPAELETVYLEPLGWTPEEFNDYVLAEYDMAIADFADFAELEATVGPADEILTEETPAPEAADVEVDLGNIELAQLQETYLTPLGWDVDQFADYLIEVHDMTFTDFADFYH
ncbi:hypothetical protein, partial [Indiicoccus explosivorum]|uniref:hypothetical protein n=1 Tax=Indiicoccus explosivorum TaxID=1917864 RepID=UPI001184ECAA